MTQQQRTNLAHVDIRLAVTDAPVGDLAWMVRCREHDDSTASLAVYDDHLHCYGCGFHMRRRIDSLAYLLNCSTTQAIRVASKYTVESLDNYRTRVAEEVRRDPLPLSMAFSYTKLLRNYRRDRAQWLSDRGLDLHTIDTAVLGHDSTRFTIPFFDAEGNLITIRFRRDDYYGTESFDGRPLPKYSGMRGRNGLYLYPEWLIADAATDTLVVCEGELDALLLWQHGIPACSPTNGAGNLKHVVKLLEPYKQFHTLIVASDQDERGSVAAQETISIGLSQGYEMKRASWNLDDGKDVTEFIKTRGIHEFRNIL